MQVKRSKMDLDSSQLLYSYASSSSSMSLFCFQRRILHHNTSTQEGWCNSGRLCSRSSQNTNCPAAWRVANAVIISSRVLLSLLLITSLIKVTLYINSHHQQLCSPLHVLGSQDEIVYFQNCAIYLLLY